MDDSLKMLLENPPNVIEDAAEILLRCMGNILRDPENSKYRRIRIAKIQNQLLPVPGAIECLFSVGFEEDGEFFTLPASVPLDKMKTFHNLLTKQRGKTESGSHSQTASSSNADTARTISANQLQSEDAFYSQLISYIQQVKNYTRPGVLSKARAYIPLSRMRQMAEENFKQLGPEGGSVDDQLLLELLLWFKESFFHWMDTPSCSACGGATQSCGHASPTPDEVAHQAHRVENYRCQCGTFTRFPRYNDPLRLLETRVGRCGEWANCFTLCCLAAGLEARFVVDWTDHVWTEVFSTAQQRWIHADPCENVSDKPLLYEAGWNKKLTYVVAFSPDDLQDVTWRYTRHPDEVLGRRTRCREGWLVHVIVGLRQQVQEDRIKEGQLTSERRTLLLTRTVNELIELMFPTTAISTEGLGGRTTGSAEWRRARGELGAANFVPHIISPTANEASKQLIEIKYSSTEDKYIRGTVDHITGWKTLVFEANSIFRKVEHDWKMVYLTRQEGKDVGSLSWKFDLGSCGMQVDKLEVKVSDYCVNSGRVKWIVCGNDQCAIIKPGDMQTVPVLAGCTEFKLSAELQGGSGDVAWQHAQLFRQNLADTDFPLHVRVHLCLRK